MEALQLSIPKNSVKEVVRLFKLDDVPSDSELELLVRIKSKKLRVREFNNYISLLDSFYGRLYRDGIYAYGHREYSQLIISEIQNGSIEVIIKEAITRIISPPGLVIVFLLMKYLPNITATIKNLAESYKFYEEASVLREERKNRKRLREALKQDEQLQKLEPIHLEKIINLLYALYAKETKRLPCAIKTAKDKIEYLKINVVRKK
jgi:hypothetical protein